MTFTEIIDIIKTKFGNECIESVNESSLMPILVIKSIFLKEICAYLFKTEGLYFDMLSCITGIDNGKEANTIEVVYNLYAIPYNNKICIKVVLDRQNPEIESISTIWRSADWLERETFDLFGIRFLNHLDLRRILLPSDWEGHPLLKDYDLQESYHGIKTRF